MFPRYIAGADCLGWVVGSATPPVCPPWCDKEDDVEPRGYEHILALTEDDEQYVYVSQVDAAVTGGWDRKPPVISVSWNGKPKEFDLLGLTPEQAYAVAALAAEPPNERLAGLILEAVEMVAPALTAEQKEGVG